MNSSQRATAAGAQTLRSLAGGFISWLLAAFWLGALAAWWVVFIPLYVFWQLTQALPNHTPSLIDHMLTFFGVCVFVLAIAGGVFVGAVGGKAILRLGILPRWRWVAPVLAGAVWTTIGLAVLRPFEWDSTTLPQFAGAMAVIGSVLFGVAVLSSRFPLAPNKRIERTPRALS